jgi:hypothetical protein
MMQGWRQTHRKIIFEEVKTACHNVRTYDLSFRIKSISNTVMTVVVVIIVCNYKSN